MKNHSVYSDKLRLSVVDLTRIDLATEENRLYHIDKWASLFKATTWEEIKIITQNDENIRKAANTVWKLSQEEEIRLQCEAHEDFYRTQRDMEYVMNSQAETIAAQQAQLEEQKKLTVIISIRQILNYARKGRPSEECADMLEADPSFVDLVYAQFHKNHEANASKIFDSLKAGGQI